MTNIDRELAPPISSLSGLRFVAAFLVSAAHGLLCISPSQNPYVNECIYSSAAFAMTLFFVLSGFVIHYNYTKLTSELSVKALSQFFIARFSRIYPLFILFFGTELLLGVFVEKYFFGAQVGGFSIFALPYYLTLTQTWFFNIYEGSSIIYQYGHIAAVSWSLSTEMFFIYAIHSFLS